MSLANVKAGDRIYMRRPLGSSDIETVIKATRKMLTLSDGTKVHRDQSSWRPLTPDVEAEEAERQRRRSIKELRDRLILRQQVYLPMLDLADVERCPEAVHRLLAAADDFEVKCREIVAAARSGT